MQLAATKLTDATAKTILLNWPASTEKTCGRLRKATADGFGGSPSTGRRSVPRIGSPGAVKLFSTQPDGLFVYFSGLESCDVVVIEVCGSVQNLNDKRSRYIPSGHSLVPRCNTPWFKEEVPTKGGGREARWKVCDSIAEPPATDVAVPIRHLRVLYALPNEMYKAWCPGHIPSGYEYFCPHSALDSHNSPKMRSFLARMSLGSQFYLKRRPGA